MRLVLVLFAIVMHTAAFAQDSTDPMTALDAAEQHYTFADARSQVVSHWPVESKSVVRLMTDLFARRAADDSRSMAHAQQQAMLALVDNPAKPDWHHPAFWAPFILVGSSSQSVSRWI